METRIGDWMHTQHAGAFWPLDPRVEEICIEDVARALSHQCRFGGHVSHFYSIAQHAVHVSDLCDPADALWGLLHDASEAYVGDVIRPLKRQPAFAGYLEIEARLMRVICQRFGLPETMPASVARADEILLATEARDLKGVDLETWTTREAPLPGRITPWGSERAQRRFLGRFAELTRTLR